jgi:hypothetical protein
MRTLDVGCGINKLPGSIGIDRNPAGRADVICELDQFPYPFAILPLTRCRPSM